ncbi:hypothetical protein [Deinococcus puniceus]|uniref:hypothetical protein n=1 Tax=Deinococcus puniceus TaxID=1182568 RepID=UPI0012F76C4B|nr:hypothetical protein [Deinococcus puniceus]
MVINVTVKYHSYSIFGFWLGFLGIWFKVDLSIHFLLLKGKEILENRRVELAEKRIIDGDDKEIKFHIIPPEGVDLLTLDFLFLNIFPWDHVRNLEVSINDKQYKYKYSLRNKRITLEL